MAGTSHPVFARVYALLSERMDRAGAAEHRHTILAGVSGRVIELGSGNGRMFAHYPPEVTKVVAVEPEPSMRALAVEAARSAPVPVTVVDGLASALPAKDGEFDVAVTALVLCSVPDQMVALREIHRVLRPGGRLCFLEHVRAESPGMRRLQRAADATLWPRLFGGCHTSRDTAAAITSAGFTIDELERFAFPEGPLAGPAATHVQGRATK
jgi:ubiquinone/menaquinone biosynthesis C-methylase UbiE